MKTLPLLLLLAAGSAVADDAALLRCRALSDVAARVACYDAIPVAAPRAVAASAPAPVAAVAPAVTPAAAPAEPAWTALPAKAAAKAEPARQPDAVETIIEGNFLGWVPNQRIRLANGQIWRVEDGSTEDTNLHNPKAVLRKGLLGAVYLDIEGAYRAPKVRRVQ
ncbi:hypothetical protein ACHMW6_26920 [Pseudoduganella sp. UC29_106]|uniref:hypothetical protein n=1 Tax=Pseudoduganella sp. UC29_106 TaxID=3374553 RepID=UPI003756F52D